MIKTSFFTLLLFGTAFLLSSPNPAGADNEVLDAWTGTNARREYTDTNSLFNVLRNVYRPDRNKAGQTATQAPYQRIAPPKWTYYGKNPKEQTESPTNKAAVDGRYYKPVKKPQKKR